jgi:DNA-binding XRE family transcriptional regulator
MSRRLQTSVVDLPRGVVTCYHKTARFRAVDLTASPWDRQSQYGTDNSAAMRIQYSASQGCRTRWSYLLRQNSTMPNIASVLKEEIARIARKELRSGTESTQKAVVGYRKQIADLKRRISALEREVKRLRKGHGRTGAPSGSEEEEGRSLRFRAAGFKAHRERLGLSAREVGLLLDASPLSVYKWETGKARPRDKHLAAIAALRRMGKREATKRLEELEANA